MLHNYIHKCWVLHEDSKIKGCEVTWRTQENLEIYVMTDTSYLIMVRMLMLNRSTPGTQSPNYPGGGLSLVLVCTGSLCGNNHLGDKLGGWDMI